MKYCNTHCNQVLFENVPELFETVEYKDAVKYGNQSAGLVYKRLLVPYVLDLIKKSNNDNKEKINNIFNMIEQLIQHDDFNVRCVAEVEFIEPFLVQIDPTKDVEKYLRPKSLAAARELAKQNIWLSINPQTWEHTVRTHTSPTKDRCDSTKMQDHNVYCLQVLFENVPELFETQTYRDTADYYGNKSAGFLYETTLVPYVLDLIKKSNNDNKEKINNIFNMIEQLIQHDDFNVRCVAEVEFIEPFLVQIDPTKDVEKYLRPKSLAAAREVARKWFKINPETWEATA